mmetsp:Transcript_77409/g.195476  ORF Transcript_77409/g.195476 Transcript_77409/m.195476 type:complete len:255 (-) Transcript_77409:351-1115(-)
MFVLLVDLGVAASGLPEYAPRAVAARRCWRRRCRCGRRGGCCRGHGEPSAEEEARGRRQRRCRRDAANRWRGGSGGGCGCSGCSSGHGGGGRDWGGNAKGINIQVEGDSERGRVAWRRNFLTCKGVACRGLPSGLLRWRQQGAGLLQAGPQQPTDVRWPMAHRGAFGGPALARVQDRLQGIPHAFGALLAMHSVQALPDATVEKRPAQSRALLQDAAYLLLHLHFGALRRLLAVARLQRRQRCGAADMRRRQRR